MRTRTRLAVLAGATAFLTLTGSAAFAVWSSSATVTSTASAATIGITQSLPATPDLTHTYSSTSLVAASPVTIVNTGNRSATYALKLLATSTSAGFPGAVAVKIAPVAATTDCTRTATLASGSAGTLMTGTLSTSTSLTATGAFAAGASVVLCVQTTMTAANVATYAEKSLTISISSTSTVGTSGLAAWTTTSAAKTVTQDVAAAQLYVTDRSGRYTIANAATCIEAYATTKLIETDTANCTSYGGQWRLTKDATSGNYYISLSQNGSGATTNWAYVATSDLNVLAPTTTAAQRWAVESRADGTYRFRSESSGLCAYVTGIGVNGGTTSLRLVKTTTCDDSIAAQGFTLTLIGNPVPSTPNAVTCTYGNGTNWVRVSWPGAAGYEGDIDYKVYVNGVFITDHVDGYYVTEDLYNSKAPLVTPALVGTGSRSVEIKQSILGSPWVTSATGSIYVEASTGNLRCVP